MYVSKWMTRKLVCDIDANTTQCRISQKVSSPLRLLNEITVLRIFAENSQNSDVMR